MNEQQDAESVTGYCPHGEPYDDNDPCPDAPPQYADTVWDQRQAEAAQRSVERFRQTAAELRTQAQSFDDLATEWEKRVAFYSEQIDGSITERTDG